MIRTLFLSIILAIGVKGAFAVASFAQDQHAARVAILEQGAK